MTQGRSAWLLVMSVVLAACASGPADATVATFAAARVEVTVRYRTTDDETGVLLATFAPTEPGIHLYDIRLPAAGIDGAGRPTLIELVDDRWRPAGPLTASASPIRLAIEGYPDPFPVYPAGPVTLSLPVVRSSAGVDAAIDVAVTFMACTESICFPPVTRHPLEVRTGSG